MVNTCRNHIKDFIRNIKSFHQNQLEAHYQRYHPILTNEGLLPDGILPPAGWNQSEPQLFNFSLCTWMAINELVN